MIAATPSVRNTAENLVPLPISKRHNRLEPYAYLRDLFTRLANGHLEKDIDALMLWAYAQASKPAGMRS